MRVEDLPAIWPEQQRRLRQNQTDAERALWQRLRSRRLEGHRFIRQFPIGRYVVDFCCREATVIVELDGGQHTPGGDAERTRFLSSRDYRVLRFWNNDVLTNADGVIQVIRQALGRDSGLQPSPSPSPS